MVSHSHLARLAGKVALACHLLAFTSLIFKPGAVADDGSLNPGFEVVKIPLTAWVASLSHALANSTEAFATPEPRKRSFTRMVEALAASRWEDAAAAANEASYEIVQLPSAKGWFVVAIDDAKEGREPIIVIRTDATRDLVAEAPHVPFEPGTGEQAIATVEILGARAAIISGAHRCASRTYTTCDGKTSVCGSEESYRDSDVGHNLDTLFHVAHSTFTRAWPDSIVVSLHGMKEDNEGVRTSFVVSNGIKAADPFALTAATKLRNALDSLLGHPGLVVSCNVPSDDQWDYRKLCGFTNVQGRHLNGDLDACHDNMSTGTGKFIHVEQDWHVLRDFERSWVAFDADDYANAYLQALSEAVPLIVVP
jgi:hypothetical protein